jgi:hypothetical protein
LPTVTTGSFPEFFPPWTIYSQFPCKTNTQILSSTNKNSKLQIGAGWWDKGFGYFYVVLGNKIINVTHIQLT